MKHQSRYPFLSFDEYPHDIHQHAYWLPFDDGVIFYLCFSCYTGKYGFIPACMGAYYDGKNMLEDVIYPHQWPGFFLNLLVERMISKDPDHRKFCKRALKLYTEIYENGSC